MNGWTSVNDHLPERSIEVLVFDPEAVFEADRGVSDSGIEIDYWGYHYRDENDNRYDSFASSTVTHWRPLPPIPKAEG